LLGRRHQLYRPQTPSSADGKDKGDQERQDAGSESQRRAK
jgi:hypothetical protein